MKKAIHHSWEFFKSALAFVVIVYALLFVIIGGDFHISIRTENITELINAMK